MREDKSQQHGTVNLAVGCSDRSLLSLQHLLSAGIYYLPQKPKAQSDWTYATILSLSRSLCIAASISSFSCKDTGQLIFLVRNFSAGKRILLPHCVSDVNNVTALSLEVFPASHQHLCPSKMAAGTDHSHILFC